MTSVSGRARLPIRSILLALFSTSALLSSGCALGNRAEIHLVRNISFGQELIDLQRAHDEEAISELEYTTLKSKLLEIADLEGVTEIVNEISGDEDDD